MLSVDDINKDTQTGWVTALNALNQVTHGDEDARYVDRLMQCVAYWTGLSSYDPDSEPKYAYRRATTSFAKDVLRLSAAIQLYPGTGIRGVFYEPITFPEEEWRFAMEHDVENKGAWWALVYQALEGHFSSTIPFRENALQQNYVYDFFTAYPVVSPLQDLIRDRVVVPADMFTSSFYDIQRHKIDGSTRDVIASL